LRIGGKMSNIVIELLGPTNVRQSEVDGINKLLPQLSKKAKPITLGWLLCACGRRTSSLRRSCLYVARDTEVYTSDSIVGMALIYFVWGPDGWHSEIHAVVVDENHRGLKIGKMLTEKLVATAKEVAAVNQESFNVYLTSKPERVAANNMYLSMGFKLVAKADGDNGTNLYKLLVTP